MTSKKRPFEQDVPRLPRYQGGELPAGWSEFEDGLPNYNKAQAKTSWLYNVKRSYEKTSEVNAVILDLRRKMLTVFQEMLRVFPEPYMIASAVHVKAAYRLDPALVSADDAWPLELQPDDGEMFMPPNGGFLWVTTPYPAPHPKFRGEKQSHVEIFGTEFHAAILRHRPALLQGLEGIKRG